MRTPSDDIRELPTRLRSLIDAELNKGEKITWIGAPIPRQFAMRSIHIVLFGTLWTAFSLFILGLAWEFQLPDFNEEFDPFVLVVVVFVLIGFGMLSSPYWWMRKAKNTAYILTTTRAIIFDGGFMMTALSYGPDRLTRLRRRQRPVDQVISSSNSLQRTLGTVIAK